VVHGRRMIKARRAHAYRTAAAPSLRTAFGLQSSWEAVLARLSSHRMEKSPPSISIVSPVFRAEALVAQLVARIRVTMQALGEPYEIVLVEDCSPDGSWGEILKAAGDDVRAIRLSRNFGQHYAISAGLRYAKGRTVVVMDCDLQDQPEEIPKLVAATRAGHEIAFARRAKRQDPFVKRLSSRAFFAVLGYLTGQPQDPAIANFGAFDRRVIDAVNSMPETIRNFSTMVRWTGFKVTSVDVAHAPRPSGRSSYNIRRLFKLALDICLVNSEKPLRLVVTTGFAVSLIGFLFAGYTVYKAIRGEISVVGYASVMVSLWILSGLIITLVGVVGLYVGKCFEGIKRRPPYIVAEVVGGPAET
jgi:glycosyltransferase involved in cell wall biosynthesis